MHSPHLKKQAPNLGELGDLQYYLTIRHSQPQISKEKSQTHISAHIHTFQLRVVSGGWKCSLCCGQEKQLLLLNCHVSIPTLILGSCTPIQRHNSLSITRSWSEEMQRGSTWLPLTCRCPGIMWRSFQRAVGVSWISL